MTHFLISHPRQANQYREQHNNHDGCPASSAAGPLHRCTPKLRRRLSRGHGHRLHRVARHPALPGTVRPRAAQRRFAGEMLGVDGTRKERSKSQVYARSSGHMYVGFPKLLQGTRQTASLSVSLPRAPVTVTSGRDGTLCMTGSMARGTRVRLHSSQMSDEMKGQSWPLTVSWRRARAVTHAACAYRYFTFFSLSSDSTFSARGAASHDQA